MKICYERAFFLQEVGKKYDHPQFCKLYRLKRGESWNIEPSSGTIVLDSYEKYESKEDDDPYEDHFTIFFEYGI